MKKILLVSLIMTCLPVLTMAQDDLYFVPKKKVEKKVTTATPAKVVVESDKAPTTVYAAPNSTVVVKDVKGNIRDVDEYNRRYTSRDNTFTMENDTLYIEEKPYNERGEWVNGFEGTQDDYEYAMRIIRFRNPRFAIPVSSPLYWDVVYALPSWEWNVFDDGFYAYAFPTYSNSLWWDWRWNYPWGSSWALGGWYSPWYNHWYGNYWYGGYWGGYWGHYHHHHHWHPHYHGPLYAGVGGYWGGGHGRFGSTAVRPGIHAGRYTNNLGNRNSLASTSNRRQVAQSGSRSNRDSNVGTRQVRRSATGVNRSAANRTNVNRGEGTRNVRRTTAGRVVRSNDNSNSVRPRTTAIRNRNGESVSTREVAGVRSNNNSYVRSTESRGSSYNRPSSTRSSVTNRSASTYQQRSSSASNNRTYRSGSSSRSSNSNSSYRSSSSSRSSGSSFSSGGGGSRSSAGGGGSRSNSGGGGSRGSRR